MASTNGTSKTQGFPPTGISILIVGAGVAGIMAAIDCHRQGHTVRIVERAESRLVSGTQDVPLRRLIPDFWGQTTYMYTAYR